MRHFSAAVVVVVVSVAVVIVKISRSVVSAIWRGLVDCIDGNIITLRDSC